MSFTKRVNVLNRKESNGEINRGVKTEKINQNTCENINTSKLNLFQSIRLHYKTQKPTKNMVMFEMKIKQRYEEIFRVTRQSSSITNGHDAPNLQCVRYIKSFTLAPETEQWSLRYQTEYF